MAEPKDKDISAPCNRLLLDHWKPVPGYEGSYEVSVTGRVRRIETNKALKPRPNERGYLVVGLATTEALSQELISRGGKVNLGETLKWIGLAAFILAVIVSIAKM